MWASPAELSEFLANAKVAEAPPAGLEVFLSLAQDAFETRSGYKPFFGERKSLTYDEPDDGRLFVPLGILVVETVSLGGAVLVQGTDYTLWPLEATDKGDPAHVIDFGGGVSPRARLSLPSGVTVDAWFGRLMGSDPRAGLVRHAHLSIAAGMAVEYASGEGEATGYAQGTVKVQLATGAESRGQRWQAAGLRVAESFRTLQV